MLPFARYVAWLKLCGRLAPEASATSVLTREMRVFCVFCAFCVFCVFRFQACMRHYSMRLVAEGRADGRDVSLKKLDACVCVCECELDAAGVALSQICCP